MRYASFFNLAYPELELDNPLSRMYCIHYASSLYGKLGDEMTGRFNQRICRQPLRKQQISNLGSLLNRAQIIEKFTRSTTLISHMERMK